MIEKNTTQHVLIYFFEQPTQEIHLRELSRKLNLSMPTILSAIKKLEQEKLIVIKRGKALTTVKANWEEKSFKWLKRVYNLEFLYASGLVEELNKQYNIPSAIICFGSYSRGEDIEASDIDIAVINAGEKEVSLEKFEKKLKRTISIHGISLKGLSEHFKANLYNGIILEGAL